MFADHTNVFASHRNADQLISIVNTKLTKVVNWLKINELSLNVKNTVYSFSYQTNKNIKNVVIHIDDNPIEQVKSHNQ